MADVALFWLCPGRDWLYAGLVKVNHCMVLQLTHLIEPFLANITNKLLEIHVGLMVCLENLGIHGSVIGAKTAEEHVAISAMAPPQVGRHLSPLLRSQLTSHLGAAEATVSFLSVAAQVELELLLFFE